MASAGSVEDQAFVTLATNDTYALGALVLANSLKNVGTTRKLGIMVTVGVTQAIRQQLSSVFDLVTQVDVLDSRDTANLGLLSRPDLGITFTKLHCWRLTQFSKCVFMDADTLVLQNCDELFEREEFSAAPDPGWPDCFNSGVFVFRPSEQTYAAILQFAITHGSFDGGDQGLLNLFFSDWATKDINKHLPFIYNVVSQAFYSYAPALKQFGKNVKVVHFIGAQKPWHATYNTASGTVDGGDSNHSQQFLQSWWNIFMTRVQPSLDPVLVHLVRITDQCDNHGNSSHGITYQPLTDYHIPPQSANEPAPQHMLQPYSLPEVSIFYTPHQSREQTPEIAAEEPIVVDVADDRNYTYFDTFYSEPPMTHEEQYPGYQCVYESQSFSKNMQESAQELEQAACEEDMVCDDQHTMVKQQQDERISTAEQNTSDCDNISTKDKTSISENNEKLHDTKSDSSRLSLSNPSNNNNVSTAHETLPADDTNEDTIGLVGELASLKITSGDDTSGAVYTKEQLASRDRQYQWEGGEVDYLGMDSFTNIQGHIDAQLKEKKASKDKETASKSSA